MGLFDSMKTNRMMQNAASVHTAGNDLQRRGKPGEAGEKYREALKLYKEAYDAGARRTDHLMSYAVLLMRFGEFAEAREIMKVAAKDEKMSEDLHFELRLNYSVCLWRLGLLDEAIKTASYAGRHAKNSNYYASLGTFLLDKAVENGDYASAKAFLDEAMEYDDEDAATLDNLGQYHDLLSNEARKKGDAQTAAEEHKLSVRYYEKAFKVKPSQITTLYALARFAKEEGNAARAKELVERALLHSGSKLCPVTPEMLRALL